MAGRLKALLRQDHRVVRVFALGHLFRPELVEMVGWLGGFDAVWFDLEHTAVTAADVAAGARAARACGLDCFARLAATDYAAVMRPLEAGVGGLMAAMVRRAQEVEELLSWAKFHPRGQRGLNGTGIDGRHGMLPLLEYCRRANADTVVGVQIERAEAVAEVERIAAVPDLDFLFVGPADLSQSLGIPGQWDHPLLWQAIERVARAAAEHRLAWAILPPSLDHARRCVQLGCRMLSIGVDAWAFHRGLRSFQDEYAEFFGA
jgi:2-dehydro-3-deoxyglucarate aldolase/4-hydroxy-2-oxoheptanedioate aldolase